MNGVDGMYSISQKKIIDDKKRKPTNTGENSKFPAKESNEIGMPHAIKMGSDTMVIKSCSSKKRKIHTLLFFNSVVRIM